MKFSTNSNSQHINRKPQVYQIQEYHVDGWDLPRGFVAMLMDYDGIEEKMIIDIRSGHGEVWPQWFKEGVENDESMYWWLYARWLYEMGKKDDAYSASMVALVFTRLDISTCSVGGNRGVIDKFLTRNSDKIKQKLDEETIRYSILNSIRRGERRIQNLSSLQMICSVNPVQRALERDKGKVNIFPLSGLRDDVKERRLRRNQESEIRKIKEEFDFNRAFKDADINTIWETTNK